MLYKIVRTVSNTIEVELLLEISSASEVKLEELHSMCKRGVMDMSVPGSFHRPLSRLSSGEPDTQVAR